MRLSNKSGARRLGVWSLCLGVLASALSAPTAHALSPGLSFSAAHLPTWQTNGIVYAMASTAGKVVADASPAELKAQSGSGDLDEVFRKVTANA